ncbi:MAG: DUF962 domain-containing protein [Candidatus Omnitrophica bacterium]|nr:DUF962 domain-containing protein [Candidatus Omnitrophota bacterium]
MAEVRIKSFKKFWPAYVLAHQDKRNQAMHFLAILFSFILGGVFTITHNFLFLVALPFVSFGLGIVGHLIQQGSLPKTSRQPIFSLVADHKMFFLILFGKMGREVEKAKLSA